MLMTKTFEELGFRGGDSVEDSIGLEISSPAAGMEGAHPKYQLRPKVPSLLPLDSQMHSQLVP